MPPTRLILSDHDIAIELSSQLLTITRRSDRVTLRVRMSGKHFASASRNPSDGQPVLAALDDICAFVKAAIAAMEDGTADVLHGERVIARERAKCQQHYEAIEEAAAELEAEAQHPGDAETAEQAAWKHAEMDAEEVERRKKAALETHNKALSRRSTAIWKLNAAIEELNSHLRQWEADLGDQARHALIVAEINNICLSGDIDHQHRIAAMAAIERALNKQTRDQNVRHHGLGHSR